MVPYHLVFMESSTAKQASINLPSTGVRSTLNKEHLRDQPFCPLSSFRGRVCIHVSTFSLSFVGIEFFSGGFTVYGTLQSDLAHFKPPNHEPPNPFVADPFFNTCVFDVFTHILSLLVMCVCIHITLYLFYPSFFPYSTSTAIWSCPESDSSG